MDDTDDIGGSGYSLEELSAYLDRERTPRIAAIESNAQCQALLSSMERMGALSREVVDEASRAPLPESWYDDVMREVLREFRAGRDIPILAATKGTEVVVTEGAVYELIRAVGDSVPGALVGKVRVSPHDRDDVLDIRISLSLRFGQSISEVAEEVRTKVRRAVSQHGDLRAGVIDVTVDDLHLGEEAAHG